jgi:hypothetical protein
MRVLIRITAALIIAIPLFLALAVIWVLGARLPRAPTS